MRELDFQWLLGVATDVHRLQQGIRVAAQAASVAIQHPDQEHIKLFAQVASMVIQSPLLPERHGHKAFELTPEEVEAESGVDEDFDLVSAVIPRAKW